jgi:arsenate reductase (glutaredoxin)
MRFGLIDKDQIAEIFSPGYAGPIRRTGMEKTSMKATIWHNPNCGTSRKTLAILEETPGVDVTVVEYLKNPPTAEKLAQLYRDAGITPQQGLRTRGTDATERGLPEADDASVLAAMAAEPILIERPLVETDKGVRLCRPQEKVHEIL